MKLLVVLLLSCAVAQDADWEKYIVGPQTEIFYPAAVLSWGGNVLNPEGVLPDNNGDAILTRNDGDDPPFIIVDFGLNVVGFLNISFGAASDNSPGIRLAFSETQQFLSDVCDFTRSQQASGITPGSDQVVVRNAPFTWVNARGCQEDNKVCADGLHGFRYVKIYLDAIDSDAPVTSAHGTVSIRSVTVRYSGFLATPDTFQGWFRCSDENLNRYWYAGVYTNDMTTDTFRETDVDPRNSYSETLDGLLVLFDGAKRDRDAYVGDIAVSGRTAYLSHGNLTAIAARNVLADLGDHQRDDGWIPPASIASYTLGLFDYPLWWVYSIWDYVLHTGDRSLCEKYLPHIDRVLNNYYPAHTNNDTKLLSRPDGMGDYAFINRNGEVAYYNALYILALKAGWEIHRLLNDEEVGNAYLSRAADVSAAFNEKFWDEKVGAYRNFATESSSHPQDANSLAILAGVDTGSRATSALNYLSQKTSLPYGNAFMDDDSIVGGGSTRVYAFLSYFDIAARFEMDQDQSAYDEINRLFGWMYSHDPNITFWEGIGPDGSMYEGSFTSSAHGWSTGVVALLTNYAVGLTPLAVGGVVWDLTPHPGNLSWAQASVPTVDGPLQSGWGSNKETFTINLDIPEQVTVHANLPLVGDKWSIKHNDVEVWKNGKGIEEIKRNHKGRLVLPNIKGGKHTIVARKL